MYNNYLNRREVLGIACGAGLLASLRSIPRYQPLNSDASVISQFPALAQQIDNTKLIYFDTAATAQRPRQVIDAIMEFYRHDNANPSSNLHSLAKRCFTIYERARAAVASFIGARDPLEIVWTRGTTESINLVASTWGDANIGRDDEI